jgi:hypothetical protein
MAIGSLVAMVSSLTVARVGWALWIPWIVVTPYIGGIGFTEVTMIFGLLGSHETISSIIVELVTGALLALIYTTICGLIPGIPLAFGSAVALHWLAIRPGPVSLAGMLKPRA